MFRWTADPLPAYDSRCALLGLESIEDRRMIASALLIRDLLCGRIDSPHMASKLRFEQRPYASRRHAKLVPFRKERFQERDKFSKPSGVKHGLNFPILREKVSLIS
jgi:hypothetical protein